MKLIKALSFFILITPISFAAYSQTKPEYFITDKGAINGYDPVAYFEENKPVKGNEKISLKWKEAEWYFASQKNLELFKANPEKYAPQYGGYCAFGMSRGYKANTLPEAWTIADGKLYLNYNLDVRTEWSKKQKEFINKTHS
jgi:YHS domain-containing protein